MVRKVARRGKQRGPAVFIAAIAGNRPHPAGSGGNAFAVLPVQREFEHRQVVLAVLPLTEARADDHGGNGGLIEHPAHGHVRYRNAVPARNPIERRQEALQGLPAARRLDEAKVLHLAPVGDLALRGGGAAQPALRQQAAAKGAVGQQTDVVLHAECGHPGRGPPVQHRKTDLVGNDRQAVPHQQAQMAGVEVGHSQVRDRSFPAEPFEFGHRIDVAGMPELPPVELQQVQAIDTQAFETLPDPGADHIRRHGARRGNPLRKDFRSCRCTFAESAEKAAGDQLGAAIVIRHVECIEPGSGVVGQRIGAGIGIERPAAALHVRDLPEAHHHAGNFETAGQFATLRLHWFNHRLLPGRRAVRCQPITAGAHA